MAAKVGQVIVDFLLNTAKFESDIKQVSKSFKNLGKSFTSIGKDLTKTVTVPLIAAGYAVVKFANDFDEGMDKIRAGTGATGTALKSLGDSMKNVMGNVPQGVNDVSTAITGLNQRLGLTGKPLEEMTTQMLNLSRITGTQLEPLVKSTTELFAKWSVETGRQSKSLDYLYKVSQSTGVGIQRLAELTVQFATPLKGIGLDLENGAAMMAQWEKEGINVEQAVMGLTRSMSAFAKAGLEPAQALRQIEVSIKGAKNETEAMAIAVKVFGTRAGPELAKAIREGRFSIEELVAKVKSSQDSINKAAQETESFSEKIGKLGNKVALAGQPLGDVLLKAFDRMIPSIESAIKVISGLVEKFAALPQPIQTTIIVMAGIAAALGPVLFGLGSLITSVGKLIPIFVSTAGHIAKFIKGIGGLSNVLTTATGSITMLGQVAVGIGAFWFGWELGKLLNHLAWVNAAGNKLAEWIVKIPGIMPSAKAATDNLSITTQRLADKLKSLGVNVDRMAGESIPAWADRVNKTAASHRELKPQIDAVTKASGVASESAKSVATAFDLESLSVGKTKDKLKELREETQSALSPMDALSKKIQDQINLGFSKSQIIKLYADEILNTSQWQFELTGKLDGGQRELAGIALGFKLAQERAEGMAEGFHLADIQGENLNRSLSDMKIQIDENIPKMEVWIDLWDEFHKRLDKGQEPLDSLKDIYLPDIGEGMGKVGKKTKEAGDSMTELGRTISTTLTNMTQSIAEKVTKWAGPFRDFAKAALSALMEGLFNPMMSWLTKIGNKIGNWLSGIALDMGGGWLSKVLGVAGSLAGGVGTAAAAGGGVAAAGGGAAAAAGGGAGAGGGIGGAIGGGLGAIGKSIAAFATNPVTIAIAAAAAAGFGIYKLIKAIKGPNSYEAASKEAARDFAVSINPKGIQALFSAFGVSEPQAWPIRKSLLSSPAGLLFMAKYAEEQNKLAEYIARLANITTSWGTFDFKTGFEKGIATGDWSALNSAYVSAFSVDKALNKNLPNWKSVLLLKSTGKSESEVPQFHKGIDYVPADTLAFLSRGEGVIPANQNQRREITINYNQHFSFSINTVDPDNFLQIVKSKVIPILKRESAGGNTGLREAIRHAYEKTARAY